MKFLRSVDNSVDNLLTTGHPTCGGTPVHIGLLSDVEGRALYPQVATGYAQNAQQPLPVLRRHEVRLSTVSTSTTKRYFLKLGMRLIVMISSQVGLGRDHERLNQGPMAEPIGRRVCCSK